MTQDELRTVAAAISVINDPWHLVPVVVALRDAFPEFDWVHQVTYSGQPLAEAISEREFRRTSRWRASTEDPYAELRGQLGL